MNCHSHECYFIENINLIFELLGIKDKIEQFNKILKENLDEISNYFAYKSILEDENPMRQNSFYYDSFKNIPIIKFDFEFNGEQLSFNRNDLKNDIKKMKSTIEKSHNRKSLESQYLEMKQKFKTHPEFLRGHTLYELLECYLKYYGKSLKNYKEYKDEIIKEMDIPLTIKVLKIDSGGYKLDKT